MDARTRTHYAPSPSPFGALQIVLTNCDGQSFQLLSSFLSGWKLEVGEFELSRLSLGRLNPGRLSHVAGRSTSPSSPYPGVVYECLSINYTNATSGEQVPS